MNIRHVTAHSHAAYRSAAAIVAVTLVVSVSGCSKGNGEPVATPSPSVSVAPVTADPNAETTTPPTEAPEQKNPNGLITPAIQNGPLKQPEGPGNEEYGSDYTKSAFEFALSFASMLETFPAVWDPKGPPPEQSFWRFDNMLSGIAAYDWQMATTSITNTETRDKYPQGGVPFNALSRPYRSADGTIPAGDWILVSPWEKGMTVSKAIASPCEATRGTLDDRLSGLLCLSFATSHNVIIGQGPAFAPKKILTINRKYVVAIQDNPTAGQAGASPFLIAYIEVTDKEEAGATDFKG